MTLKDWLEILISLLVGATIGVTVTINRMKATITRSTRTTQTGNRAGGNIVGGDYTSKQ